MRYIATPKEISSTEILSNGFSLSPSQYKKVILPNPKYIFVKDFLTRELKFTDLGNEVGSINYIRQSPYYFMRTKALQSHSYIPDITPESTIPVMPKAFSRKNLKKDDIIISKDSNIGEAVILDKDYPNIMLSGALYKLPIKQWKYYLLAFLKHDFFREQLDFMVPKSATIRHAKTIFCDCKIPLPQKNQDEVIQYVEVLTRSLVEKQKMIQHKHKQIHQLIEKELFENQLPNNFKYEFPNLEEVKIVGRLDTSRYSAQYKHFEFLLSNYYRGKFNLRQKGFKISRGQNLQVTNIGMSFYSCSYQKGFYELAVSSNFSEFSTLEKYNYLGNTRELKAIKKEDIIFSCRGIQFGRVVMFPYKIKAITNIDNVHIQNPESTIHEKSFITMFLNFLRWNKHIYKIAVTGSGANSLTQYQFDEIFFPNFPEAKQKEIAELYHNPAISLSSELTLENFSANDSFFNEQAGILELDKVEKQLKARLDEVLDQIVNDIDVEVDFSFLYS